MSSRSIRPATKPSRRSTQLVNRRRNPGRVALAGLVAGVVGVLSGCGSGGHVGAEGGDVASGQKLFTAKCASCHTMKAANAQGTLGPNLDTTFRAAREQGMKESSFADVVAGQIRNPGQYAIEGDQEAKLQANMPANLVRGDDLADVAAFVAKYAGSDLAPPGGGASAAGGGGTDGKSIFGTNCASCHTLAAAGATGTVGPNLDDLKPSLAVVKNQVIHGGGAMPAFKGRLTDKQIEAVAKFVADSAGK